MTTPLLVDSLLLGERQLERRLAAAAQVHPHTVLKMDIRPEIDQASKAFFAWLDRHQSEILFISEDDAIMRIEGYSYRHGVADTGWRDRWLAVTTFERAAEGRSTLEDLTTLPDELRALRAARKAAAWIENSGLLGEVCDYAT